MHFPIPHSRARLLSAWTDHLPKPMVLLPGDPPTPFNLDPKVGRDGSEALVAPGQF